MTLVTWRRAVAEMETTSQLRDVWVMMDRYKRRMMRREMQGEYNDLDRFLPERDYVTFGSMLSQIRLSSVCRLSSVTFVHPTQGVDAFGSISSP